MSHAEAFRRKAEASASGGVPAPSEDPFFRFSIALGSHPSILPGMDSALKVRENRLRRAAKRQGLELQRFRSLDHRHALFGTYQLVGPDGSAAAANTHPAFGRHYGLTIEDVEKALGLTEGSEGQS
jgi:hypothetical protein